MKFFVPNINGQGEMPPDEAEIAWQACRKGAEMDMGRDALARRVYRLEYIHNGREMKAVVGEPELCRGEDLGGGRRQRPVAIRDPPDAVMAIIAFPGCYSIRCVHRGYLTVGDPIVVGEHSVRAVKDFE